MFSGKQIPTVFPSAFNSTPMQKHLFSISSLYQKPRYVTSNCSIVKLYAAGKKKGLYLTWCIYTLEVYLLQSCILTYIIKHSHALCLWTKYMKLQVSHSYNYLPIYHPVTYQTFLLVKWHSDLPIKASMLLFATPLRDSFEQMPEMVLVHNSGPMVL